MIIMSSGGWGRQVRLTFSFFGSLTGVRGSHHNLRLVLDIHRAGGGQVVHLTMREAVSYSKLETKSFFVPFDRP